MLQLLRLRQLLRVPHLQLRQQHQFERHLLRQQVQQVRQRRQEQQGQQLRLLRLLELLHPQQEQLHLQQEQQPQVQAALRAAPPTTQPPLAILADLPFVFVFKN